MTKIAFSSLTELTVHPHVNTDVCSKVVVYYRHTYTTTGHHVHRLQYIEGLGYSII